MYVCVYVCMCGRICVKIYRTGTPDTIQAQCDEHELIHGT